MAGHSKAAVPALKEPLFFLASIGVSVAAALEQAKRTREKYNYGEIVSREKPVYAENEFVT